MWIGGEKEAMSQALGEANKTSEGQPEDGMWLPCIWEGRIPKMG